MRRYVMCVGRLLLVTLGACGESEAEKSANSAAARMEDMRRLKTLVGVVIGSDGMIRDGELDVYRLVEKGIGPENYVLFRSVRAGTGPTDAEIEKKDYTNFAWERYRGRRKLHEGPRPFPLLWEKKPDEKGEFLVALSDGSVTSWDRQRLDEEISLSR